MAREAFNEKKKEISCTTFGESFTNYDDLSKLVFSYSNKFLGVGIIPLKNKTDYVGDVDKITLLSIRSATSSQVADMLREAKDDYKNNKPFNYSIRCGVKTTNAIGICDGTVLDRPYGIYFVIYDKINSDNIPKRVAVYTLKSVQYIKNYDYKSGKYEKMEKPFREIKDIINTFEDFARYSNKAAVHVAEDTTKWRRQNGNNAFGNPNAFDSMNKKSKLELDNISMSDDFDSSIFDEAF